MYCFVIGLRHTLLITQRFSSWCIWDVSTILENNCSSSCDIKNYNVRLCLHPYIFLITCHHSGLPLQCGMYPTHSARCVNGSLRRENGRKVTLHVHASSHIHPCQFAYDQLTGSNKSIVNNNYHRSFSADFVRIVVSKLDSIAPKIQQLEIVVSLIIKYGRSIFWSLINFRIRISVPRDDAFQKPWSWF